MPAPTGVSQQTQLSVAAGGSATGNFAANVPASHVAAVAFVHDTATVPTVTGSGGTWTRYAAGGNGLWNWDLFICVNPSGSAKNVVVTCGGSTRIVGLAVDLAGVDQTNPFDVVAHLFNAASSGATPAESVIPLFPNAGVLAFMFEGDILADITGGTAGGFTALTGKQQTGGIGTMSAVGSYRLSTPAAAGAALTTLAAAAAAGARTLTVPTTQVQGVNDPSTGQATFYPVPSLFTGSGSVASGSTVMLGAGTPHAELVVITAPVGGYGPNVPPLVNVTALASAHVAGERISQPASYGTTWNQAPRKPWGGFAVSLRGAPLAALNLSMTMAGSSSMSAWPDVSGEPPAADIIEFALLDGGTMAQLAILSNATNGSWADTFNDAGSGGTFDLPVSDPKAALIATGHAISCRLNGLERFRYWLDDPQKEVGAPDASDHWTCSGRGWETYLERGSLYPASFGTGQLTSLPVGGFAGAILTGILAPMQARGALPRVTWDFSETYDSAGNPWTQQLYFTLNVGDNLSAIIAQLRSFGIAVRLRPDFVLQCWEQAKAGRHLETAVVLREGYEFAGAPTIPYSQPSSQLRTRMVVEGDNGVFVETFNATLEANQRIGRREGYLRKNGVTDPGTLKAAGDQFILDSQTATESITVPLRHGGREAYVDFAPGDWIALDAVGTWNRVPYRAAGVTVAQADAGGYEQSVVLASLPHDAFLELVAKVAALS